MGARDIAAESRLDERKSHQPTRERIRRLMPSIDRELDTGGTNLDALLDRFADETVDPLAVPPLRFGQIAQGPEELRIESLAETRNPIVPQAIAREATIPIAFVLTPGDRVASRPLLDLPGHDPEKRTEPAPIRTPLRHRRESIRAGSPQDAQQHGLRLITGVVGGRDPVAVALVGDREECRSASVASGLFKGGAGTAIGGHAIGLGLDTNRLKTEPGKLGPLAHEPLVGIGCFAAQSMIHMRHHEFETTRDAGTPEQIEQHHRISPTGHRDEQSPIPHSERLERLSEIRFQHGPRIPPHRRGPHAQRIGFFEGLVRCKCQGPHHPVFSASAMNRFLDHNVGRWVTHWAETAPAALAWADDHRRCDYAAAEDRVARLASWFRECGVEAGDRIALWLGNRGATLEALFAAARLGAIALPVNARLTPAEVTFQLDDSTPRILLVESAWRARAHAAIGGMVLDAPQVLEVGGAESTPKGLPLAADDAYEEVLASSAPTDLSREAGSEDPVILMYTSGTTGKPKGALLPLRKTLYNSLNAMRFFGIEPVDRVLVVAPLFHSLGLQILAIPAIFAGAGLVIQEGFDAPRVWRTIASEGVTYFGGVPTMHQRLLEALVAAEPVAAPPPSLRFAFTAGAAAPAELIRAFHRRGLLMKQGYGQTETSILTCLDSERALVKAGSVGRPVHHAEIRLIDPATIEGAIEGWRDVRPGEIGEIVVAGPIRMLGYWQRPEATAETLRGKWLRTGDLATRDDAFDLTLVGRAREMFISGGENVYPAEIEAALIDHPAIEEAAIVGVPDPEWGEVGHAHVVARAGREIVADEILEWLSTRLARFKLPRKLVVAGSLPRTASGKIQKHRLRSTRG
ncbi:MAG: hypothetical protein CL933_23615 [Deltaproteobacteria bacterium]|nr:hypothetical protein [Deltaproteobacteria bacterium]